MSMFKTISNRVNQLGYIGDFSEILDFIAKEYANLPTDKDQIMFAEKIAGKFHFKPFVDTMGALYPFDQKIKFSSMSLSEIETKDITIGQPITNNKIIN